jgi:hypothetical protein
MLPLVFIARTDVSEEGSATIIKEIRIGELGTTMYYVHSISSQRASVANYC